MAVSNQHCEFVDAGLSSARDLVAYVDARMSTVVPLVKQAAPGYVPGVAARPPDEHRLCGQSIRLRTGLRYDLLLDYVARRPSMSMLQIGLPRTGVATRLLACADSLGGRLKYVAVDRFGAGEPCDPRGIFCGEGGSTRSRIEAMDAFRRQLGTEISLRITVLEGASQDVLPVLADGGFLFDMIMVDGGKDIATVRHDWKWCQHLLSTDGLVIFDDYPNWGILPAVAEIDRARWSVRVLEHADRFRHDASEGEPTPYRMHQLVEVKPRL